MALLCRATQRHALGLATATRPLLTRPALASSLSQRLQARDLHSTKPQLRGKYWLALSEGWLVGVLKGNVDQGGASSLDSVLTKGKDGVGKCERTCSR